MREQQELRHLQMEREQRMRQSGHEGYPFRTPEYYPFDYEAYDLYGSEDQTASANYRPGNSATALRRKQ